MKVQAVTDSGVSIKKYSSMVFATRPPRFVDPMQTTFVYEFVSRDGKEHLTLINPSAVFCELEPEDLPGSLEANYCAARP